MGKCGGLLRKRHQPGPGLVCQGHSIPASLVPPKGLRRFRGDMQAQGSVRPWVGLEAHRVCPPVSCLLGSEPAP